MRAYTCSESPSNISTVAHTCTVPTSFIQDKPVVADALEAAVVVLAPAVHAEIVKHLTLVDVYAGLLRARAPVDVAHVALATKGSYKCNFFRPRKFLFEK